MHLSAEAQVNLPRSRPQANGPFRSGLHVAIRCTQQSVPKRTNDFQALIALVERQLAASGVRVVESEMLADRLTGELREVDVCVHATVSGKDVTLALECRDHKRKADQIWIDTLRGKYANLPVDKAIAVARAGFAKTARAAAEKARIQTLTLEEATSANWHLIAELPDAALVVAHFPVAENVSLHLVKGQEPIPDTMMVADLSLRLGDQTLPLADVLHWYCTASPVAQFTFDNDDVERLPVTIAMPDGIELVLPSGDSRLLERIELEIAFDRERSNTKFDRKIYGDTGLSFASKTYTRGAEKAHFVFSMLQQGDDTSAAAAVRTSDGRSAFVLSPRVKSPAARSGTEQSD